MAGLVRDGWGGRAKQGGKEVEGSPTLLIRAEPYPIVFFHLLPVPLLLQGMRFRTGNGE